ncbi:hypothetical protein SMICM304S_10514 [Streptomyces microflavus]
MRCGSVSDGSGRAGGEVEGGDRTPVRRVREGQPGAEHPGLALGDGQPEPVPAAALAGANAEGEAFFVKYHFKTNQGVRSLSGEQAAELVGKDANSHQTDLLQAIERGVNPSWTLHVQVMPAAEAAEYRFNPFDLTKVWPHSDYPLQRVGRLVLDRNPDNVFAEVEQAAFSPNNFVPGIGPSPDGTTRAGCSPTPTRTATGWASTTPSCR